MSAARADPEALATVRDPDHYGSRAAHSLGAVRHAPVHVAQGADTIAGAFAHVTAAIGFFLARALPAAVVVGDEVGFLVLRAHAGADPGHLRGLRARGALADGSAAGIAERAINAAVSPVLALRVVLFVRDRGSHRGRHPLERQQRQDGPAHDHRAELRQKAPPAAVLRRAAPP